VISTGAPLLSFPVTLKPRFLGQAMQKEAAVTDIRVAPRLLFTERSPHCSNHDAN
jgi:hypothetical protein